jgi:hypothetical protein
MGTPMYEKYQLRTLSHARAFKSFGDFNYAWHLRGAAAALDAFCLFALCRDVCSPCSGHNCAFHYLLASSLSVTASGQMKVQLSFNHGDDPMRCRPMLLHCRKPAVEQ